MIKKNKFLQEIKKHKSEKSDVFEKNFKELSPEKLEAAMKEDKRIATETMAILRKPIYFR